MEPKAYFAKAIYYKEIFILSRTFSTISSDTVSNKVSGFYTFCEQICTFGVIDDDFQINRKIVTFMLKQGVYEHIINKETENAAIFKSHITMKHIEVAAAIIYNSGSYFACQRGYGDFEGLWEFPGGKIEPGESPEDALKREVQEELGIDIAIDEKLCTTEYDYPSFHLKLHCYLCSIISGEIELREHHSARWFNAETLDNANWLPADKVVIEKLKMRS